MKIQYSLYKCRACPKKIYTKAFEVTKEVDLDDTEFIALTEHLNAKLWSGDKELRKGLTKKGWNKFISNDEVYSFL